MRTVVAVTALSLLLSGVSMPSAQATDLPQAPPSFDEPLADQCDTATPDYSCGTDVLSLAQVASGACTQTERVVGGFVFIAFTAPDGLTCITDWTPPAASVRVDYLVVGGGGGGGAGRGGGGGAGGFIGSTTPIDIAGPTTVQVGGGGVGGSNTTNNGTSGADSKLGTFAGAVAKGGGYGAGWNSGIGGVGGDGGSGGGASGSGYGPFGSDPGATATSRNGGSGELGQGSSGGSNAPQGQCPGWGDTGSYFCTGGGGGGAESAGTSGSTYVVGSDEYRKAGNGGAGKPAPTWLTASARIALGIPSFYAGGGGGAGQYASRTPGGDGGTGGGGDGCGSGVCNGEPGTANAGGGGGGSEGGGSKAGNGGSGIVVIRYASSCSASSPTTSGVYTVVNFTTAGSCTWTAPSQVRSIDVLAVGGGGGGGAWVGAGGGGGEVTESSGLGVTPGNSYTVTVGAGGWGAEMRPGFSTAADALVRGSNGRSSFFGPSVTALGGGVGGSANLQVPGTGDNSVATGGGAPYANVNPGVGKVSSGGVAGTSAQPHPTGGGGGAQSGGGGGQNASPFKSGAGGAGKASTITGVTYGGGGGGSAHGTWPTGTTVTTPTNEPGAGGDGGGGAGGRVTTASSGAVVQGVAGTDGLGGGGGGGANLWISDTTYGSIGGDGGDGTVIVRYFSNALATNAGGGVQPGNYTIGSGWVTAPKVQLVTASGATVTSVNVSITATFTASSGSATLANATAVTDANGVADFSGMTVSGAAGTSGTLTFTATGYGPVTSTSFSIVRAAQGALTVTSTSGTYGTALSLTTSGGSGTGAVTYSAANGTALGCTVSGSSLTVTQAGTCLVTATKAEDASYSATSSPQTTVTFAKAQQAALSIDGPYSLEYGETFPLTTTGGSGTGAVSYSRNGTTGGATCTVANAGSSSTVKGTKAGGTCLVGATKAGDVNYDPVLVEQAFTITTRAVTVTASSPSVTYPTPIIQSYSVTSGTLATGDAISSITYTYQGTGSTTYGPSTTAPTGAGTYSVAPSAATFSAGLASNYAIQYQPGTVTINQATQIPLAIVSDDSVPFGTPALVTTTGGSGTGALSVSVAGGTATGCALTDSSLTATSIGTCVITASKSGDDNHLPAATVTKTVTVTVASQAISFTTSPPLIPRPLGTYAVAASATSGLPVSLAVTTGLGTVCSITGSGPTATLTFAASGRCVITATQAGNGNINPAPSVTQTIDVGKLNQSITFAQPADRDFGAPAFALSAVASSGLPVRFALDGTSTTNSSCSVDDTGIVTINAVGACGITVTQTGNAAYAAASPVTRVFQVRVDTASAPYITGVNVQNGGATLTFAVPGFTGGAPIAGYQVNAYPAGGGAPVTFNGCPTTLPLECTMQGLTNGVGYRFTVQAINPAGAGAESPLVPAANQSPITSAIRPAAVSGLIAVRGNTTLQALWDPLTVAQLGGGSFTEYRVSIALASGGGSVFDDTLGSQSDDSYTFTGLTNGVPYVITIVAITQANSAAMEGNTATVTEIPARAPDAVMGMYVPTSGTTGIVSWSPPVSDGGSPVVEYRVELTSGGTTVVALTLGAGVFSTPVTGLTRGTTYAVRMTVVNAVGPTDVTHNSTQPNVPTAPVITNATPVTVDDSRGFEVTWTAPADNGAPITGYQVTATKRSAMSGLSVRAASVDDTQFTCTSSTTECVMFAPGSVRDYAFVVVADNLAGLSDPSAPFVVPDPTPPGPGPGPGPIPPGPTPPGPQPLPGPVAPGELVIEVDGRPDGGASGGANSTGDGLQVSGPSYSVSIRALDAQRLPVPLGERDSLVAYTRQRLQVGGEGFQPATYAAVYVMNPVLAGSSDRVLGAPVRLGTVLVGGAGTFTGSWVLPSSVTAGQYVLQVVGTLSRGSLLSVDTGLTVKNVDRRSITIAGQRVKKAKPAQVKVFGRAWDLNGVKATARVKLQGQTKYSTGSSRVIRDGEFTWQRKTAKKVYVYFQADGVRSQRVIIDSQRR